MSEVTLLRKPMLSSSDGAGGYSDKDGDILSRNRRRIFIDHIVALAGELCAKQEKFSLENPKKLFIKINI